MLRCERSEPRSSRLARFQATWNHVAEKESRQINMWEQILVAKVFNFCGICSRATAQSVAGPSRPALRGALDHDDFGLNQSKIINVIEVNDLEHDVIAKVYQLWRIML